MRFFAGWLLLLVWFASLHGDEGLLTAGNKLNGSLQFKAGKLFFRTDDADLPADKVLAVSLPGSVKPFLCARPIQVWFHHGERLTGELLGFDIDNVALRTPWADRLEIPRKFVSALTPAGPTIVSVEDFETKVAGWQLAKAALSEVGAVSGRHSLKLSAARARAILALPKPLSAGRLAFHVRLPAKPEEARSRLVLDFGKSTFTAELAGPGKDFVAESTQAGTSEPVPRSPGWHRIEIRFTSGYLLAACDGKVFWSSKSAGPGGPLKALEFRGDKHERAEPVLVDDVVLRRRLEPARHPPGAPDRDEAWLASGDQLFGKVVGVKPGAITFEAVGREETMPWSELRGLYFRVQPDALAAPLTGTWVRLHLRTGIDSTRDRLEGVVAKLDDKELVLRHPVLGEVKLARERIARLEPIGQARRIELRPGQSFRLEKIPARTRIIVEPLGAAARPVLAVRWSGALTINGKRVDALRFTNAAYRLQRQARPGLLRVGDNFVGVVPDKNQQQAAFRVLVELIE